MPEVDPLRPDDPSRVGPYLLLERLGEGGQGVVYLGQGVEGRRVAVKLLHAQFAGNAAMRKRFLREAVAAQKVARFCIAQVVDVGVESDRPYIVSEYVEGRSLQKEVTQNGSRTGADLDRLAISTITALAAIHSAGIVHRDFKPANVILSGDGPRVIDFGIARAMDGTASITSHLIGTPAYMAPELMSDGPITPAVDIFAWAVTIVYAATGRTAFGGISVPAVMNRILTSEPDLGTQEQLADPLRSLVLSALSKNPEERPTARDVLHALVGTAEFSNTPSSLADGRSADKLPPESTEAGFTLVETALLPDSEVKAAPLGRHVKVQQDLRAPKYLTWAVVTLISGGLAAALSIFGPSLIDSINKIINASTTPVTRNATVSTGEPSASKRPAEVAPLGQLRKPHLFVVSQKSLTRSMVQKIVKLRGVQAVDTLGAATVSLDGRNVRMIGVDPSTFRAFTPRATAKSDVFWQRLADGEFAVSSSLGDDGLPPGKLVTSAGQEFRIAASAEIGISSIDAITSKEIARKLGILERNALIINAPGVNIDQLRGNIQKILPADTQTVLLNLT